MPNLWTMILVMATLATIEANKSIYMPTDPAAYGLRNKPGSFEPQIGRIANKAYQLRLNQNKADFARLQSELDAILGELGLLISTVLEEPDRQLYRK